MLDSRDRLIVEALQDGLPICERPFREVADDLDLDETVVIDRLGWLLQGGYLTRFGPMFDIERLGGTFVLAAMAVPEADFERVSGIVNDLPEIVHNYQRDHHLNMWFVVAAERPEQADDIIARIEGDTGYPVLALPKEAEYRISMRFALGTQGVGIAGGSHTCSGAVATTRPPIATQDRFTRAIVVATQAGLPLVERPFHAVADQLGLSADDVLNQFVGMQMTGVVRRIAAVPDHRAVGVRANAMTVWNVPDGSVDHWGKLVACKAGVSHCYRRPRRLPDWPYNLFVMLRGPDRPAVEAQVQALADLMGPDVRRHEVLYATRILKKTGVRLRDSEDPATVPRTDR